jgi:hypothetical protein
MWPLLSEICEKISAKYSVQKSIEFHLRKATLTAQFVHKFAGAHGGQGDFNRENSDATHVLPASSN